MYRLIQKYSLSIITYDPTSSVWRCLQGSCPLPGFSYFAVFRSLLDINLWAVVCSYQPITMCRVWVCSFDQMNAACLSWLPGLLLLSLFTQWIYNSLLIVNHRQSSLYVSFFRWSLRSPRVDIWAVMKEKCEGRKWKREREGESLSGG